jgi:hypothetical protein
MNAIILASVFAGAYAIFLTADPQQAIPAREQVAQVEESAATAAEDKGFMTRDVTVDPKTGEEEETSVIGFLDS